MTPMRTLLHGARIRIARSLQTPKSLPAHHKVVVLGACLLLTSLTVASIGIWGVTVMEHGNVQLARGEAPALALLLQIDRDLYQAQLGLERASTATDPVARKAALDFFAENLTDSEGRFTTFKGLALGATGEAAVVVAYEGERARWIQAAQELTREGSSGTNPTQSESTRLYFDTMRGHVNRLIDNIYQPAIAVSGDRADRDARLTRWKLLAGMAFAIVAGVVLTRNMAVSLRAQRQIADSMDAEREQQNRRQTFESRLNRGLGMTQDEPATLRLVEEVIAVAAPGIRAEVLLADSSRAHMHRAATTDREGGARGCAVAKPSDCPAVRRGHRLSFASGSEFDACPHLKGRPGGSCSAVCIPLSIMGQAVGVMHVTGADGHLPPEEQILALEQVASKSGERIGLLRAFSRTEAQAASDPLTGLMNRRSLEEKVHEMTRQQIPFAVAYGDLDHFKNLNDTHGHETGDKALRTFAQVLKTSVRPGDLAARWGGEEFVLVLPRATADEAVIALDRVRAALTKALRGANTPVFTVSFGVAQTAEGSLFVDVLARADESLLRAKKEGRNRTIASDILPIPIPAAAEDGKASTDRNDDLPTSAAA